MKTTGAHASADTFRAWRTHRLVAGRENGTPTRADAHTSRPAKPMACVTIRPLVRLDGPRLHPRARASPAPYPVRSSSGCTTANLDPALVARHESSSHRSPPPSRTSPLLAAGHALPSRGDALSRALSPRGLRRGPLAAPRVAPSSTFRSVATTAPGSRSVALSPLRSVGASRGVAAAAAAGDRSIVDVLKERGLLDACTNEEELRKAADEGSLSVYCGFDPTADSLHLGNLLGIVVLAWFQRCGHAPVALLGGATGRVGDPSGKSAERPVLDEDTINANTAGIQKILEGVLANSAAMAGADVPAARVMNNLDWFGSMGFLEFLREIGKYARVGTMMAKDSVKTRLDSEQGMSFTEFSYQLLQGYDFCHLYKEHDVRVQVGGSDQWGNITAGTDLIRRILARDGAYGCTFPLLLKADGRRRQIGGWRRVALRRQALPVQVLPIHAPVHRRRRDPFHAHADVHVHRRDRGLRARDGGGGIRPQHRAETIGGGGDAVRPR